MRQSEGIKGERNRREVKGAGHNGMEGIANDRRNKNQAGKGNRLKRSWKQKTNEKNIIEGRRNVRKE